MRVPINPKIYHIVHVDRLPSIISNGCLFCDAAMINRNGTGTIIGMSGIKGRRLRELKLNSHNDLFVGDCVPFYFCPRSIMLYILYQGNHPDLDYRGGQTPIVHLEADMQKTIAWATSNGKRWAFTNANAGSYYFEDWNDANRLDEIDWDAVNARNWNNCKDGKQAEFLIETSFPWQLVERIGVHSQRIYYQVATSLQSSSHSPNIDIKTDWYY